MGTMEALTRENQEAIHLAATCESHITRPSERSIWLWRYPRGLEWVVSDD
jgi:hypothetical protein